MPYDNIKPAGVNRKPTYLTLNVQYRDNKEMMIKDGKDIKIK